MRFFSMDGPLFRFLSLVSDLLILNIVYVITCIPIFTIGTATSALYRTMLDKRYGRPAGVRSYFRFFKSNFRQSTLRYLFSLLIGAVLVFDIWFTRAGRLPMQQIFVPLFFLMLTVLSVISSWVLALTGQFSNTAKKTFKNAALLAPLHPSVSLLFLLRFIPAALAYISEDLFLLLSAVFFLIYYALSAYLAAGPMSKVFLQLMTPEEAAELTEKGSDD